MARCQVCGFSKVQHKKKMKTIRARAWSRTWVRVWVSECFRAWIRARVWARVRKWVRAWARVGPWVRAGLGLGQRDKFDRLSILSYDYS